MKIRRDPELFYSQILQHQRYLVAMHRRSFTCWLTSFGKSFYSKRTISLQGWTIPKVVTSGTFPSYTVSSPSLATLQNSIVLAFRGTFADNTSTTSIFVATSNNSGDAWNPYEIPNLQTNSRPALCTFGDKAVVAYRNSQNQLGISWTTNPSASGTWVPQSISVADVCSSPSVESNGDSLYVSFFTSNGGITALKLNSTFTTKEKLTVNTSLQDTKSPHITPTLFKKDGSIWIAVVKGNEVALGELVGSTFQDVPVALPSDMVNMISMNAVSLVQVQPVFINESRVFMALKTPELKIALYSLETNPYHWQYWKTFDFISSGSPAITVCGPYIHFAHSSSNVTNQTFDGNGDPKQAQLIFTSRCTIMP